MHINYCSSVMNIINYSKLVLIKKEEAVNALIVKLLSL